jgi:hypothetical protein
MILIPAATRGNTAAVVADYSDLTPVQRNIMQYFARLGGSDKWPADGVDVVAIAKNCPGSTVDHIQAQVEYLVGEGHLYSTIDDSQFVSEVFILPS